MRVILGALVLLLVPSALAGSAQVPTTLERPPFPPPAGSGSVDLLTLESSRYRDPALLPPSLPPAPAFVPKSFRGAELSFAIGQPPHVFAVYEGRYLVKHPGAVYAFDFIRFMRPPNGGWAEEIRWAREVDGVLYVSHANLGYATVSRGRNAYVTAVDVETKRILWRSPALVANARTFVVAGDLIVAGYGFTAEPDFLYALDRRTGRVLDRLAVPSAPEIIRLRGDSLHVRTYDRQLTVRLRR